jgi:hypothetical protein
MTPGAWLLRLLLAALLFFGADVLFWTHLHEYTLIEWVVRLAGYVLLATGLLDILVRYRVRDGYVAMALFAGAGLVMSVLIAPGIAFEEFPVTLLTRALGGYTVLSFFMFGAFVALLSGHRVRSRVYVPVFALWLGFCFGIWMRWTPEYGTFFDVINPSVIGLAVGGTLALILLLYAAVRGLASQVQPPDMLLHPLHWLFLALGLTVLFLVQGVRGTIDSVMLVSAGVLIAFCWSILWSQRDDSGAMLMNNLLPLRPLPVLPIVAGLVLFGGGGAAGYALPLLGVDEFNQLWVLQMYLTLAGIAWLPFVAIVIAVRALDAQTRQWSGF